MIKAESGDSYIKIYEDQINEVLISANETNEIQCIETIKKILFDGDAGKNMDFSHKGKHATMIYKGRENVLMMLETTKRAYTVLLKPTVGMGPRVMLATASDNEKGRGRQEYLDVEDVNHVQISNREVNRITCDDGNAVIEAVDLPEDSGILVDIDGSDAYLQYWGSETVSIAVKTTDKVYQVVAKPMDTGAKTLILKNSKNLPAVELYGNTREEIVVKLIKAALTKGPELKRATVKQNDPVVKTVDGIEFVEYIRYEFTSEGICLVEYWLRSKEKVRQVDEEYILGLGVFNDNVMGIGLSDEHLYTDRITRLFLVGSQ